MYGNWTWKRKRITQSNLLTISLLRFWNSINWFELISKLRQMDPRYLERHHKLNWSQKRIPKKKKQQKSFRLNKLSKKKKYCDSFNVSSFISSLMCRYQRQKIPFCRKNQTFFFHTWEQHTKCGRSTHKKEKRIEKLEYWTDTGKCNNKANMLNKQNEETENERKKKSYEKRQMMMMMPLYNYLKRLQNSMPEKEMMSDDLKLLVSFVLCAHMRAIRLENG